MLYFVYYLRRGGTVMKQNEYFDYDGDISSAAPLVEEIYLPGRHSFLIPSENIPDAPVAEVPETELPSSAKTNAPEESQSGLSADILDAIQAFESMNLSAVKSDEASLDLPAPKPAASQEAPEEGAPEAPAVPAPEAEAEKAEEQPHEDFADKLRKVKKKAKSTAHDIKELKKKEDEKEVSKLKHFFIIVALFLLVIVIFVGVVFVFMQSINKENERIAQFNKEAAEICSDYSLRYGNPNYENLYDKYKVEGYGLTGVCFVRELDFDNDGISELMITFNKNGTYTNEVWGYSSGKKFKRLFSEKVAQKDNKKSDAYSILYRNKNRYFIAKFDDKKLNKFSLYHLRHGEFVKRYDVEYDKNTKAYTVDGKDDTDAFEKIKYAVLKEEKASVCVDDVIDLIDSFKGSDADTGQPQENMSLEAAYYSTIEDYNKRYGVSEYKEENGIAYIDGLACVEFIDFDGDGKNELLLVYRKTVKERQENERGEDSTVDVERYFCDIYRYSGSRAVIAYTDEGISNKLNNTDDIYYIVKRDKVRAYYCSNSFTNTDYGRHITAVSTEYKYQKNEFKQNFRASYTTDYGYSKYEIDGESVDKDEFNEKGYKNPLFDEEKEYDKGKYRVVYVQRKKLDGLDMKEIPKETENNIKSLNRNYNAEDEE